jgi:5-enolpyruvylshikimate-3-phosphate synthase
VHVPCSEEAPVAVQLVLVFLDFSAPAFGLVPTIAWNATTTIGAENTTGIKDMRVKEGDNIF